MQADDPAALAELLRAASPSRAFGFALARHEAACAAGDDPAMAHWADVLARLSPTRRDATP